MASKDVNNIKNQVILYRPVRDGEAECEDITAELHFREIKYEWIKQYFPDTPNEYCTVDTILTRHPSQHPKYRKFLIPANRYYEILREQSEHEFCRALIDLGAKEMTLIHTDSNSIKQATKFGNQVTSPAGGGGFGSEKKSEEAVSYTKTWRLSLEGRRPEGNILDERTFFDALAHNCGNESLRDIFHAVKTGQVMKTFKASFDHSVQQNTSFETAAQAKIKMFNAKFTYEGTRESNEVREALFEVVFK